MAAWQFDIHAIPRRGLDRSLTDGSTIPGRIDEESFESADWWLGGP
jgi:hypothetical protein